MLSRLRARLGGRPAARPARRVVPLADDERALHAELSTLPPRARAAVAAACAERLYPAYDAFVRATGRDDDGLLRQALDLAWEGARTGGVDDEDPSGLVQRCVSLIPGDEAQDSLPAHAEDAIAAVAYALQAAAGLDPGAAGWAARRVTDTLDSFILESDVALTMPDAEQRVREHPLVRTELSRRDDDLRRLRSASSLAAAVDSVRARAVEQSALPLDRLDHGASARARLATDR